MLSKFFVCGNSVFLMWPEMMMSKTGMGKLMSGN